MGEHYSGRKRTWSAHSTSLNVNTSHFDISTVQGVRLGDGDGTVPLMTLGYMCRAPNGWRNRVGRVVTREFRHNSEAMSALRLRGNVVSGDHVDLLGNFELIETLMTIATGVDEEEVVVGGGQTTNDNNNEGGKNRASCALFHHSPAAHARNAALNHAIMHQDDTHKTNNKANECVNAEDNDNNNHASKQSAATSAIPRQSLGLTDRIYSDIDARIAREAGECLAIQDNSSDDYRFADDVDEEGEEDAEDDNAEEEMGVEKDALSEECFVAQQREAQEARMDEEVTQQRIHESVVMSQ